jgi:hypothetical protein
MTTGVGAVQEASNPSNTNAARTRSKMNLVPFIDHSPQNS